MPKHHDPSQVQRGAAGKSRAKRAVVSAGPRRAGYGGRSERVGGDTGRPSRSSTKFTFSRQVIVMASRTEELGQALMPKALLAMAGFYIAIFGLSSPRAVHQGDVVRAVFYAVRHVPAHRPDRSAAAGGGAVHRAPGCDCLPFFSGCFCGNIPG